MIQSLAFFGGGILSINMLPQIYKVYKSKSSNDLSYFTIFLNIIGLTSVGIYAISLHDISLYVPIFISLFNSFTLLGLKSYYEGIHYLKIYVYSL